MIKRDLIKTIEKLENGFKLNNSITVFNISWDDERQEGEDINLSNLEKLIDAEYDIEYDEKSMSAPEAIELAEFFFSDVIVKYLAGEFRQTPPKLITRKLRTPSFK